MENSKFVKISKIYFVIFASAIIVPIVFSFVFAYSPYYTHPDLTEEIAKLWNLKNNNQNLEISQNEIEWMRQGAMDEDKPPRWINNFYDPTTGEGLIELDEVQPRQI